MVRNLVLIVLFYGCLTRASLVIPNGTVTNGKLATGAVTSAKILDGTIASGDISTGAVTTTQVLDATLTSADLSAAAGIVSGQIADGTIASADISASAAIPYSKLYLTGSIVAGDLATGVVDASTITAKAPVVVTDATYTVLSDDYSVICNRAATVTLTLPTASSYTGRVLYIKGVTAYATSSASSNVLPMNSMSPTATILSGAGAQFAILQSNGTYWVKLAGN